MYTEAVKRAQKRYYKKLEQMSIRVPMGWKYMVNDFAHKHGYSTAQFVKEAVEDKLKVLLKKDWAKGKA